MAEGIAGMTRALRAYFATKVGDNTLDGNLYPSTDVAYDIGAIGSRWRAGFFDQLAVDTLTVRQIQNLAIRPNLLRNGGFEEADSERPNQPLGWIQEGESRILGPLYNILDDTTFPVDTVADSSLLLGGIET